MAKGYLFVKKKAAQSKPKPTAKRINSNSINLQRAIDHFGFELELRTEMGAI
jgi:hypothetical protein